MRRFPVFRNSDVARYEDLPHDDTKGSLRKVLEDGKLYLCVSDSLALEQQWLQYEYTTDPTTGTVAATIFSGPVLFKGGVRIAGEDLELDGGARIGASSWPSSPPVDGSYIYSDGGTLKVESGG